MYNVCMNNSVCWHSGQGFILSQSLRVREHFQMYPSSYICIDTVQYSTVQYRTSQYSIVQYITEQYSTVQYSTVQYSTVQYSTVQYSTGRWPGRSSCAPQCGPSPPPPAVRNGLSSVLYCTVLYCTALYCTVLYCNILYCTVLYCTVLYCTVLYCTVLYCTVLYCTVLYCPVLYCIVLYCTVLYCTVMYCTVLYCAVIYCTVLHCHKWNFIFVRGWQDTKILYLATSNIILAPTESLRVPPPSDPPLTYIHLLGVSEDFEGGAKFGKKL